MRDPTAHRAALAHWRFLRCRRGVHLELFAWPRRRPPPRGRDPDNGSAPLPTTRSRVGPRWATKGRGSRIPTYTYTHTQSTRSCVRRPTAARHASDEFQTCSRSDNASKKDGQVVASCFLAVLFWHLVSSPTFASCFCALEAELTTS